MPLFTFIELVVAAHATIASCPNITSSADTKPLYLLTLVPFPDNSTGAGWDDGLGAIPGARVARDEINNRTDLLPGYHIELIEENVEACSRTDVADGLSNLVKYTVNPPCRPLAAVIGLLCSSHTEILSPIAGKRGMDVLQLAVANAPVFSLQNNSFPHLWRFLGTGTVLADAALALMDRFQWSRVGIIYSYGSTYFTSVATYFQKLVQNSGNKSVIFNIGLLKSTDNKLLQQTISDIKTEASTVLFVSLNDELTAELLCRIAAENLTYPSYIWMQVGKRLNRALREPNKHCNDSIIIKAKRGHIDLDFIREDIVEKLISGEEYSNYEQHYHEEKDEVEEDYNTTIMDDLVYSNLLYDQVWAFALAMNNSLPVLAERNLSIDDYTIGQNRITKIIEEQLARVNFQGSSGVIKFDEKHGVPATVGIYHYNRSSNSSLIGTFAPLKKSAKQVSVSYNLSTLTISNDDVPDDEPPVRFILIPLPAAIALYSAAGVTLLFTTIILILLMFYREWPEVKASSPYISLFMIAGCYLLCVAAVSRTTYGWRHTEAIQSVYIVLVTIDYLCTASGLSMVIVTMFFRLLRVYHIFSAMNMKMRMLWRTWSLSLMIFVLTSWVTIVLLVVILTNQTKLSYSTTYVFDESILTAEKQPFPVLHTSITITLGVIALYLLVFLLIIVYLAIRMRKIKRNDFKDTKKINLFVVILTVTLVVSGLIFVPLTLSNDHYIANIVLTIGLLIIPNSISIILFLPKVIPAMLNKKGPRKRRQTLTHQSTYLSMRRQSTRLSIVSLPSATNAKYTLK